MYQNIDFFVCVHSVAELDRMLQVVECAWLQVLFFNFFCERFTDTSVFVTL